MGQTDFEPCDHLADFILATRTGMLYMCLCHVIQAAEWTEENTIHYTPSNYRRCGANRTFPARDIPGQEY